MRTKSKGFLALDFGLQLTLVGIMLLFYVLGLAERGGVIFALLAQFFVGCWQVLSGVVHSIAYQDVKRQRYTAGALGYVLFLILTGSLISNTSWGYGWTYAVFLIVFLIIIPVGIAIWYLMLTHKEYQVTKEEYQQETIRKRPTQEDLLDDIEWQ